MGLTAEDLVIFTPREGKARNGVIKGKTPVKGVIAVLLEGDPYAVCLPVAQLHKGVTVEVAELRREAARLKIEGWEELTIVELEAAVTEARGGEPMPKTQGKSKAKPKAKAAARRSTSNSNGVNPYREGSQRWHYAEALLKGGKLTDIADRVRPHVKIKPSSQNNTKEYREASLHGRAVVIARDLAARGFDVEITGRGKDSVFSVRPPKK